MDCTPLGIDVAKQVSNSMGWMSTDTLRYRSGFVAEFGTSQTILPLGSLCSGSAIEVMLARESKTIICRIIRVLCDTLRAEHCQNRTTRYCGPRKTARDAFYLTPRAALGTFGDFSRVRSLASNLVERPNVLCSTSSPTRRAPSG
jgi:hypothetical protein